MTVPGSDSAVCGRTARWRTSAVTFWSSEHRDDSTRHRRIQHRHRTSSSPRTPWSTAASTTSSTRGSHLRTGPTPAPTWTIPARKPLTSCSPRRSPTRSPGPEQCARRAQRRRFRTRVRVPRRRRGGQGKVGQVGGVQRRLGEDDDSELFASDVGIDGGAASAERPPCTSSTTRTRTSDRA